MNGILRTDKFNGNEGGRVSSVLVVDDESTIRELLQRWLQVEKYEIRQAQDAEAALELMIANASDVVLCDVEMPGHGGLWLIEQIRERYPRSAVVLATAIDSVPPSIGLRDGVTGYVVKPFNRERVLKEVKNALRWHDAALAGAARARPGNRAVDEWLSKDGEDA
jgi:two-component system C4-dicarboxylate transport response regulator DctD